MIVRSFVTANAHLANSRLAAFLDTNFDIDGVVRYILLHWNNLWEQVAVVQVYRSNVVSVRIETYALVQVLRVVDITAINFQDAREKFRFIFCIPYESNISEIVLFTFLNSNVNLYKFVTDAVNRIAHYTGITVPQCVVLRNDGTKIFTVLLLL